MLLESLYSNEISHLHANESPMQKIYLGKNYYNNITTAIQKYDLWKMYIEQFSFTRKAESTYDKSVGIHDKM